MEQGFASISETDRALNLSYCLTFSKYVTYLNRSLPTYKQAYSILLGVLFTQTLMEMATLGVV